MRLGRVKNNVWGEEASQRRVNLELFRSDISSAAAGTVWARLFLFSLTSNQCDANSLSSLFFCQGSSPDNRLFAFFMPKKPSYNLRPTHLRHKKEKTNVNGDLNVQNKYSPNRNLEKISTQLNRDFFNTKDSFKIESHATKSNLSKFEL